MPRQPANSLPPDYAPSTFGDRRRWLRVFNQDTQPVPAYGIMMVAGVDANSERLLVQRPSADGMTTVLFNGPIPIAPQSEGQAHQTFPTIVAYVQGATTGNDPAAGNAWGVAANTWTLAEGKTGFYCIGGTDSGSLLTNVLPAWQPQGAPGNGFCLSETRGPPKDIPPEAGSCLLRIDPATLIYYVWSETAQEWPGYCPCVIPGSSSSGSGSSSGASGSGITDTALGSAAACGGSQTSLTIPRVTVTAGALLVVNVGTGGAGVLVPAGVTFAGLPLTMQGSDSPGTTVTSSLWYLRLAATTTGDIVVSLPTGATAILASAVEVQGLAHDTAGGFTTGSGAGTAPATTAFSLTAGTYYFQGAFMLDTPGGGFTWSAPFTAGGQDVSSCSPYVFTEGWEVLALAGSGSGGAAGLAGVTPAHWSGIVGYYY